MTGTLRDFVIAADRQIEKLFRKQGHVLPMYHYITGDGDEAVSPAPVIEDRDLAMAIVRAGFELMRATRYVFITEAWTMREGIDEATMRRIDREGLSLEHVPGRKEVVTYIAEDQTEPMIIASREIIRPPHGRARLGQIDFLPAQGSGEGRMVGLLPQVGAKH